MSEFYKVEYSPEQMSEVLLYRYTLSNGEDVFLVIRFNPHMGDTKEDALKEARDQIQYHPKFIEVEMNTPEYKAKRRKIITSARRRRRMR